MNIVVTGSSSGIGQALAGQLLARGDHVWLVARSDQTATAAGNPATCWATRCDVADWGQVQALAAEIARAWPRVDALVACAGAQGAVGRTLELDPQTWATTVRTNLEGTLFPLRALWPQLQRAAGRAKVVCFSGGGATKARPNFSAYGCAKTAIVRLVETIAGEYANAALDINAIAPGAINTRMTDEVVARGPEAVGEAEYRAALAQKASGGGSMERALALVAWLLSPASDGVTGRLISAPWDPWASLDQRRQELIDSDIYTLRRITPEDRNRRWS